MLTKYYKKILIYFVLISTACLFFMLNKRCDAEDIEIQKSLPFGLAEESYCWIKSLKFKPIYDNFIKRHTYLKYQIKIIYRLNAQ